MSSKKGRVDEQHSVHFVAACLRVHHLSYLVLGGDFQKLFVFGSERVNNLLFPGQLALLGFFGAQLALNMIHLVEALGR